MNAITAGYAGIYGVMGAAILWTSLPAMDVAIGGGNPFHVAYGANGMWLNATGDFFDMTITDGASYARYVQMYGGVQFSVPVLSTEAILGTAGNTGVWSCVTGACSAFLAGWGF
jgi:hypothetical protein